MAAGVVMFSSVLVLLTAFERLTTVRSLDSRNAIEDLLAQRPASSLGLDIESATQMLYFSGVIAALCASATAILGWYVLKPDTSARRGLTILAVPLFLTGLAAGGFAASFVAAGVAMLWMQPAREWFATGRWTPPSPVPAIDPLRRTPAPGPFDQPVRPQQQLPEQARPDQARPDQARPEQGVSGQIGHHQWPPAPQPARPHAMVAAFVLTVVMAGGVLALSLLSLALVGLSPDLIMSELERQQPGLIDDGLTLAQMQLSTYVSAGATIVWCGAALVFAGFAMARRAWARRGLMITAAFSAGASILVALTAPVLMVPAAAAVATVVCLRRTEVRSWFAGQPH